MPGNEMGKVMRGQILRTFSDHGKGLIIYSSIGRLFRKSTTGYLSKKSPCLKQAKLKIQQFE